MGVAIRSGARGGRLLAGVLAALAVAGCSSRDATAPVMEAVLKTLTSDGRPICLDSGTSGEPLAIFRTMMRAPDPSRQPLAWYPPGPLRPDQNLSLGRLIDDEFRDGRAVLRRPDAASATPLPATEQRRLNAAALRLVNLQSERGTSVPNSSATPGAKARWWVSNRMDGACKPVYTLSHPVVMDDIAFVTVLAGHWGTTYALERKGGNWSATARWSNWLY